MDKMQSVFMLLGGLGIFLYGIKTMGESLKNYAGDNLRDLINKYTNNPFKGVLVGAASTVAIQSSSGTTALTISLVRAGLMTLPQAIGVIMGANIGTTVTAFLIGLSIKEYALPIIFVGAIIYMFSNKKKTALFGQIVFGFGALFYGMALMETPLKELANTPAFSGVMSSVAQTPLLGILIGAGLTMIVQSSSATIGILQGLYLTGYVSFPVATAILLGDNIGTTITSLLASLGGSRDSKRAALSHVFFNVSGSIAFFIILYVFGGIGALETMVHSLINGLNNVFHLRLNAEMDIAFIHLIFNFTVTAVLIWFVKYIEMFVKLVVPVKADEVKVDLQEHYLDEQLIHTSPMLALDQGKDALVLLGETTLQQLDNTITYIDTNDNVAKEQVLQLEIGVNTLDKRLKQFYSDLMGEELSVDGTKSLNSYMYSINEYERVGDICEKIVTLFIELREEKRNLSEDAKEELLKMIKVARSSIKATIKMIKEDDITLAGAIIEKEKNLNSMERKYYKRHLKRVKEGTCKGKVSILYVDLISDVERIGDHAENIVEYYTNVNQILTEAEEEFDLSDIILD